MRYYNIVLLLVLLGNLGCSTQIDVQEVNDPVSAITADFPIKLRDKSIDVLYSAEHRQRIRKEGFLVIYGRMDLTVLSEVLHGNLGNDFTTGPIGDEILSYLPLGVIRRNAKHMPYPVELVEMLGETDVLYILEERGLLDNPKGRARLLVIRESSAEFAYLSWDYL